MNENNMQAIFELSPCDDSLPTRLLQEVFDFRVKESSLSVERLYRDVAKKARYTPVVPEQGKEKLRLVVDVSDEFFQDYKDGVIKLAREKGGLVAQLKDRGRYGRKLPIKEEKYIDGADALDVQNALQLQAIQEMLITISEQIRAIDENVKEVLIGQQNDRLGLYYSGVALFIEAHYCNDESFKKQLIAQSVKTMTDAVFQLTLTLQSDIAYLARAEYDKDKKNKFNLINEKIDNINRSFMAIHQASVMKAAIYCQLGEIEAMAAALHEYEHFIEGTIVCNAEMLAQCDMHDDGKISGIWKKRANLQLEIGNTVKCLRAKNAVLYLENKGE